MVLHAIGMRGNSVNGSAHFVHVQYHVSLLNMMEELSLRFHAFFMYSRSVLIGYDFGFPYLLLGYTMFLIHLAKIVNR